MGRYNCSIDECEFETHSALGMQSHARKHKRQYRELTGEQHDTYDDVRDELAGRVNAFGDLIRAPEPVAKGEQTGIDAFTVRAFKPGTDVEER